MAAALRGRRLQHYASTLECVRHHYVRKWKYIVRFEIISFFLEIGLGGWGTEGRKAPTLGQYVRERAAPFR